MIHIKGLSFRFRGSRQYALRDVNLHIAPGEFVVIAGPSGCGKSTLALAMGGYLFRQYDGEATGTVRVNGMDASRCPIYDIAETVGLVQQSPEAQFCTLTVQDEVAFGLENRCLPGNEIRKRMNWALEIVGASHLMDRHLATLSGGEKQKVAIAAVMALSPGPKHRAAKPQMLIFDEPTSNLDPSATAEIFKVIAHIRAKAGITVVVIEHKVDFVRHFRPRLVAMENGGIVYDGPLADAVFPRIKPSPYNKPYAPAGEPVVCARDLHVGYNGDPVLHGVSLEIHRGEFVAVIGDNGSGKTTFLQSLMGLLKPSHGSVKVLGQDTRHAPVSQLARQVGFVFQNPDHQLFAESVWQEAAFAPRNLLMLDAATEARIQDLLAHCGLQERRDDHPYRLSYGQKRRLNLISALSHAPRLILLDELLIGQDPANASFLLELLRERTEAGDAVIMVNHAPDVTRCYASRLIFFNGGRVVVDAPTEEAFQQLRAMGQKVYLPRR